MARSRPGVFAWLYYALGGTLRPRHAQWVLHDLTSRWWFLRHCGRALTQTSPSLLFLLLPLRFSALVYVPLLVILGGLWVSASFAWEARNQRLYQHGFVPEVVLGGDDEEPDEGDQRG